MRGLRGWLRHEKCSTAYKPDAGKQTLGSDGVRPHVRTALCGRNPSSRYLLRHEPGC